MNKLILGFLLLTLGGVEMAKAHPVSFQGAVSLMSKFFRQDSDVIDRTDL